MEKNGQLFGRDCFLLMYLSGTYIANIGAGKAGFDHRSFRGVEFGPSLVLTVYSGTFWRGKHFSEGDTVKFEFKLEIDEVQCNEK